MLYANSVSIYCQTYLPYDYTRPGYDNGNRVTGRNLRQYGVPTAINTLIAPIDESVWLLIDTYQYTYEGILPKRDRFFIPVSSARTQVTEAGMSAGNPFYNMLQTLALDRQWTGCKTSPCHHVT